MAGGEESQPPSDVLLGKGCKCRKRFSAGVPGAVAPGKKNLESPPSPEGKGLGGWGQKSKLKAESAGGEESQPPPDALHGRGL